MRLLAVVSKLTGVSTNIEASEVTLNSPSIVKLSQLKTFTLAKVMNKASSYLKIATAHYGGFRIRMAHSTISIWTISPH